MSATMAFTERDDEAQAVPDVERGGVREVPDTVTWLQLCGTDTLHALPRLRRGVRHYTLGSTPDQDVVIPSPYVSAQHCRLVRTPLAISLFRERPLVAIGRVPGAPDTPDPEDARRDLAFDRAATVMCDLADHHDRLDPALTSRLFCLRYQTRVIALARTIAVANAALGERYVKQMTHVRLEPLSRRSRAIHRLLDRVFEERGSSLRVVAMTPYNQDALLRHRWARNFASLREAADRLIAVARGPSLRRAALALGIPPATFHHWYANILGLDLPLLAGARTLGDVGGHR